LKKNVSRADYIYRRKQKFAYYVMEDTMAGAIGENIVHLNLLRNLTVNLNYITTALKRTNVNSRDAFQRIIKDRNNLSPQDIGDSAKRIAIDENQNKTPQDRFIDTFV